MKSGWLKLGVACLAVGWAASNDAAHAAAERKQCSPASVTLAIETELERFNPGKNIPGATAAVFIPGRWSNVVSTSRGWSDYERRTPMKADDRMLAGSVGKTFFAAAALRLVDQKKLDLDKPIATYLPKANVPNGNIVTTRMLLSHTSGYGEYDGGFMDDLIADPLRVRVMEDWLGPIRRNPPAKPGGFRYSDINFVILAAVVEAAAGMTANDYIRKELVKPLNLTKTAPTDNPRVAGLVQGYAGPKNFFARDTMLQSGVMIYNPQFEWGGGGMVSTSGDLAKWIVAFSTSTVFSKKMWDQAKQPLNSRTPGEAYGLGIHVDQTPMGLAYGHGGYIPGYLSWVRWYEKAGIAIAAQINTSDKDRVTGDGYDILDSIAKRVQTLCG